MGKIKFPQKKSLKKITFILKDVVVLVIVVMVVLIFFKIIDVSFLFSAKPTQPQIYALNPYFTNQTEDLSVLANNKALRLFYTTYEYEGIIKKINLNGGLIEHAKLPYKVLIVLSVGSRGDEVPTYYTKDEEPLIRVFRREGEKTVEIKLTSLKEGDRIVVSNNISNRRGYPTSLNKAIITKM